jgi:hypothetical protein
MLEPQARVKHAWTRHRTLAKRRLLFLHRESSKVRRLLDAGVHPYVQRTSVVEVPWAAKGENGARNKAKAMAAQKRKADENVLISGLENISSWNTSQKFPNCV